MKTAAKKKSGKPGLRAGVDLKLAFDVLPHNVIREGNDIYAVFKIIIGFAAEPKVKEFISREEWIAFAASVNSLRWYYTFDKGVLQVQTDKTPNLIQFRCESSGYTIIDPSLNVGKRPVSKDKWTEAFESVFKKDRTKKFYIEPYKASIFSLKILDQLGSFAKKQAWNGRDLVELNYSEKLAEAYRYSKEMSAMRKAVSETELNFKAVYSSILDEPLLAEKEFGLVREFRIKMSELKVNTDTEIDYAINVVYPGKKKEEDTSSEKMFLLKKVGEKYYNGLKKMFITNEQFQRVECQFSDPYKAHLTNAKEKGSIHPDGIYMLVDWRTDGAGKLKNPFTEKYLKGFNVVLIHPEDNKYKSLSWHCKTYEINEGERIMTENTSGVLIGNGGVETKDRIEVSNVLFAWKGDNLIVNYGGGSDDSEKDDTQVDGAYSLEGEFVKDKLFTLKKDLVESSQQYLWCGTPGKSWEFILFLRTVTPLEGCLPAKEELNPSIDYMLTVEDIAKSGRDDVYKAPIPFNSSIKTNIPIKAPLIIGPEKYKNAGSEYVDQEQHMVLSRSETSESRFIFPPALKFEDFKFFGFLHPDRIKKYAGEALKKYDYVTRCINLEDKAGNSIKPFPSPVRIDYIADARGTSLFFFPNDLFTINRLVAKAIQRPYVFTPQYPFFNETFSKELNVKRISGKVPLTLTDNEGPVGTPPEIIYDDMQDGIYNFKIYSTDGSPITSGEVLKYNPTDIRISILSDLKAPLIGGMREIPGKVTALRNVEKNRNYWYHKFSVEKDQATWMSLKYSEQTEVLRITDMLDEKDTKVNDIKNKFESSHGVRFSLFKNEFPYEIFLEWSGTDLNRKDNALITSVYPAELKLVINVTTELKGTNGLFFSLPLNDATTLSAELDTTNGVNFLLNDTRIFKGVDFNKASELTIEFVEKPNAVADQPPFEYYLKYKGESYLIGTFINPTISVYDIKIDEKLFKYLNLGGCKLNLIRSGNYVIIGKEKDSFYSRKKLKLFASSAFQAYFPKSKSEWDMGQSGTLFQEIEIPNNTIPGKCVLDTNLFVMQTIKQRDPVTEITMDNVIMITLQNDFMLEGPNLLGLVLAEMKFNGSGYVEDTNEENTSEIGEDVTKLTSHDLSGIHLGNLLNYNNSVGPQALNKYYNDSSVKFYRVKDKIYKILECKPHYNALLRNWQVMLGFNAGIVGKSESVFVKLSGIKIVKGHGMQGDGLTPNRAFIDGTRTSLSDLSTPVHLPVYNQKRFTMEKALFGVTGYRIRNTFVSDHKNKVYFVMVFKLLPAGSSELDKTLDLLPFDLIDSKGNSRGKGKVLHFTNDEVIISPDGRKKSIVVLEYEIHANFNKAYLNSAQPFVDFNPLFDKEAKGLRLINVVEFEN